MAFVNLHVHTAKGSLLDSILTPEEAAGFAARNGQTAMAVTDHGSMAAFVDFAKACAREGVKPIIGNEVYEVDDMAWRGDTRDYSQPRYHLVLLARTQEGFRNLLRITSISRTEGLYRKPRIDMARIASEGLGRGIACLTGCQAGRLSRYLSGGMAREASAFVASLCGAFDSVACEIQSHDTEAQARANALICDFARAEGLPLVATTDAHMPDASKADSHAMFVQIGEGREAGETYVGCHLQTEGEVARTLAGQIPDSAVSDAIAGSVAIADSVGGIDIGLGRGSVMPRIDLGGWNGTHEEYLRSLVYASFREKFGGLSRADREERRLRIESELPVLFALGYTDYFIMLSMLASEARARGIPMGYSRGSGANCLCLFMLGVTQIDSVRWGLDFSRFANLGRKSMADFDFDISKRRRKEMVEISMGLFGNDCVAPIATYNTLSTKVAIRDIGKVLNESEASPYRGRIPYSLRDETAKCVPTVRTLNDLGEEEEGKDALLRDVIGRNARLRDVYERFPLWLKYVMDVEGLPKSMGRHAAGTLITPGPVTDYCPLCLDSKRNVMTELEMHNAMDDLGLVKMDYLGLETLDVVDDALASAGLTWGDVDINHLDLRDGRVYREVYAKGNTVGVFQMESAEARRMCVEAGADCIEDVIAVSAANRPGTKDSFPEYCRNKRDPGGARPIHEDLAKMFANTHGVLLYQEQALQLFRYAGFPEERVDSARRAIGKKDRDVMDSLEADFRSGLEARGWREGQVDAAWRLMVRQSGYCFNRGHAVAYGLLSYLTAYLKTHYDVCYMAALLTSKSGRPEKIAPLISECRRLGIRVLPPDVNRSGKGFTPVPERREILFGFLAVKGIGESAAERIVAGRPYGSLAEVAGAAGDKGAVIALIKSGALPTRDRMGLLRKYAASLFERSPYRPVTRLPSGGRGLAEWGIDMERYWDGFGYDREAMLRDYNAAREAAHERTQDERMRAHMAAFRERYAGDEYLWEFETLSAFLTNDPLKGAYDSTGEDWEATPEGGRATLFCVITDVKRRKDRHGRQYAYLDLYTPFGMVEATAWAAQMERYAPLTRKGACLAMLGRKEDGRFVVERMRPYGEWAEERAAGKGAATGNVGGRRQGN